MVYYLGRTSADATIDIPSDKIIIACIFSDVYWCKTIIFTRAMLNHDHTLVSSGDNVIQIGWGGQACLSRDTVAYENKYVDWYYK